MEEIYHALGHRVKLESLAQTTLGEGKLGTGMDAIWYYKNNDWESLIKYCLEDVRVTRDLYEYGRQHGHLWYDNLGKRETIPVRWGSGETVKDLILKAYLSGEQVEIDYLKSEAEGRSTRKIEIKSIKNNQVQAFCHLKQAIRFFNLDKIIKVNVAGHQENWQTKLF
jgi:hypothetical protein